MRVKMILLAGMAGLAALAQQGPLEPRPKPAAPPASVPAQRTPRLRVDATLITVPVTVADQLSRPVTGLEKESFKVFDAGIEQEITHFSMDDQPAAIALVFDTSASMGQKLARSRSSVRALFRVANEGDEFLLITFDDAPHLAHGLTKDVEEIQNAVSFAASKGNTVLYDAVVLALHELKKSTLERKAVIVISDGGENRSRYQGRETLAMIRESDALIYAIGVYEANGATQEEIDGPDTLREITELTGGRTLTALDSELPDVAGKIGVELRNRYMLGYAPKQFQRDGKYHPVQVKVIPPRGLGKLKPYWRTGYYAPAQ